MKPGPLRRLAGSIGLVALTPTAYLLAAGSITRGDAALRAAVTLAGVMVFSRLAAWWLRSVAGQLEGQADRSADDRASGGGRNTGA